MMCQDVRSLLTAYALDDLNADQKARVAEHLESCEACEAELATEREVLALLRSELKQDAAGGLSLGAKRIEDIFEAEGARSANVKRGSDAAQRRSIFDLTHSNRWLRRAAVLVLLAGFVGMFARHLFTATKQNVSLSDGYMEISSEEAKAEQESGAFGYDLQNAPVDKSYTYNGSVGSDGDGDDASVLNFSAVSGPAPQPDPFAEPAPRPPPSPEWSSGLPAEAPATETYFDYKSGSARREQSAHGGSAGVGAGGRIAGLEQLKKNDSVARGDQTLPATGRPQRTPGASTTFDASFDADEAQPTKPRASRRLGLQRWGKDGVSPVAQPKPTPVVPAPRSTTRAPGERDAVTVAKSSVAREVLGREAAEKDAEIQDRLIQIAELEENNRLKQEEIARLNDHISRMRLNLKAPAGPKSSLDHTISLGEGGGAVAGGERRRKREAPQAQPLNREKRESRPAKDFDDKPPETISRPEGESVATVRSGIVVNGLYANRDFGLRLEEEDEASPRFAEPAAKGAKVAKKLKPKSNKALEKSRKVVPSPPTFNDFVSAAVNAVSTFAIDVDTASYTLVRNALSAGRLPEPGNVRVEEVVNFFDYQDEPPVAGCFAVHVEGAPTPFGHGLRTVRIGVKGRRLGREEQRPAVLTFLVDTSGSMERDDRIGLVKQSLNMLLEQLGPNDRVAIVQYDSHARILLEHTPVSRKQEIQHALKAMQCSGSTNLEAGMKRAYAVATAGFVPGAENRVLLMSDGVANLGSREATEILQKVSAAKAQGISCSVFGVGMGNYDDEMLEQLADKGDGAYRYLDSEEEARRVFVDDLSATLNTIAADVKIQVVFNPKTVAQYRQLGYENRQLTKEQFRDDSVDAGEVGSGQSVTALYELEPGAGWQAGASLFIVRVRYRDANTGVVREIEKPVTVSTLESRFADTRLQFRLAVCAAEFAELLRGSPHASGSSMNKVAEILRPIALELNLDTRISELLRLVEQAGRAGK